MVQQAVEVGKEWAWLEAEEAGMMREDWEVGGGIKAAFSCLEESYEPTSSVRMHTSPEEIADFGPSALQQPSIRFFSSSRAEMGCSASQHSSIRSLYPWGGESSGFPQQFRFDISSTLGTLGKSAAWAFHLRDAWSFTGFFFFSFFFFGC